MAIPAIDSRARWLQHHGIAPSTRATYQHGWSQFCQFCNRHHFASLPASENTTIRFVAAHSLLCSYSTLKVYIAAIRHFHLEFGFSNPLISCDRLAIVLRGVQRTQSKKSKAKLPICFDLLQQLIQILEQAVSIAPHDKAMYKAAFTLASLAF